jgi:hypothetical protein
MKSFRDIRVLPVVLVAVFGLAVLKVAGLVLDGGYVFEYRPDSTTPSWAQESFNFPGRSKPDPADVTGSVKEKPKEAEPAKAMTTEAAKPENAMRGEQAQSVSPSERAILERLQARRQELEARAREIDIRESLLKAAEKRVETRVEELKAVESRITVTGRRQGVRPARNASADRNRLADSAAQDGRYPWADVARGSRAAHRRNGASGRNRQIRLHGRSAEDRR